MASYGSFRLLTVFPHTAPSECLRPHACCWQHSPLGSSHTAAFGQHSHPQSPVVRGLGAERLTPQQRVYRNLVAYIQQGAAAWLPVYTPALSSPPYVFAPVSDRIWQPAPLRGLPTDTRFWAARFWQRLLCIAVSPFFWHTIALVLTTPHSIALASATSHSIALASAALHAVSTSGSQSFWHRPLHVAPL